MKIGILGGTFNPVHNGHLILAEEVREKLGLDKIIFVPANLPPHKDKAGILDADLRLRLLDLAIKGNNAFSLSDIEIKRKGPSYTIDSVREFKKIYPDDELYFVIGSDLLSYLDEWRDISEVSRLVKFVVATRPGFALEEIPKHFTTLAIRAVDISGVDIRKCAAQGKSFRYLVPEKVYQYIKDNKLYQ